MADRIEPFWIYLIFGLAVAILLWLLVISIFLYRLLKKLNKLTRCQKTCEQNTSARIDQLVKRVDVLTANLTWAKSDGNAEKNVVPSSMRNILLKPNASRVEFNVKAEKEHEEQDALDEKYSLWEQNNFGKTFCHEINLDSLSRTSTPVQNVDGSPTSIGSSHSGKPQHQFQQQTHYFTTTAFPILTPIRATTAEKTTTTTSTHFSCLDMKMLDEQHQPETEMLLGNPTSKSSLQTEVKQLYTGGHSPAGTSSSGFHSNSDYETHIAMMTERETVMPTQALLEVEEEIDRTFTRLQERIDPVKSKIMLQNFKKFAQDNNNNKN